MVDEKGVTALVLCVVVFAAILDIIGTLPGLLMVVGFLAVIVLLALGVLVLGEIRDGSRV